MTDFYALLKQSILDRGIKDAGDRSEVYAQARRAVIKQLWDFRPPLAADEIDTRVGAYDTAVERIEADLQVVFANGSGAKQTRPTRPPPPPARLANYSGNGRGQSAMLAEWAREQPEYAPGVPRAPALPEPLPAEDEYRDEPVAYEDEEPEYEPEEEEEVAEARARPRHDRWSAPGLVNFDRRPGFQRPDWLGWLGTGDQLKVRLLAIAISALFIVLVGVGAYFLGTRSDRGVTVDIGVRREVSDAATAARIPKDNVKVAQSFAVFDGRDPTIFATTPDNPIRFNDADRFARISSSTSASGVKVVIGPGLAARLAGHQVRVVIVARSSTEGGAAGMRFAYQSGLAISHWQTASLTSEYQELGMVWRVPTMRTSPTGDLLLLEPGIPGDGTGADIQSIRIDILAQ